MKILSRYFCIQFFKILVLCQITFLTIYLITDFLQKIDNFIEANVSNSTMLSYFFYKSPLIMIQMIPAATLISVIIMFSLMKRNNEITAMKACGLNVFKLSQPIIVVSLFLGIAVFLFSETIVPYTSSKSNRIWNIEVEKKDRNRFYGRDQIWYRGSDSIYWIRHFDYEKKIMENPSFFFFDKGFGLIKKIDGLKGVWNGDRWKIEKGIVQEARDDGSYELMKFDERYVDIPETPETFVRNIKSPEEMGYWQLKRYAERVRSEGYDDTRYVVDMNIKISFPLIMLILVVIGIPLALGQKKGRTPLAVLMGMGICFLYMLTLGFSRSLGLSGILPPILSAWLANLVFSFLGIYLMIHIER